MHDCETRRCPKLSRRTVLLFGASALGLSTSCAILRGGARHPRYEPSAALRDGTRLHIPRSEFESVASEGVLEIRPSPQEPALLLTRDGSQWLVVTAECPHQGCTVDWAGAARRWTCPCHGSAFAPDGALLEGPADEGLVGLPVNLEPGADGKEVLTIDLARLPART